MIPEHQQSGRMAYFKEAQLWFGFDLLSIMGRSMEDAENMNQNRS